ncbi:unnamed protein product [Sphagnum jensenii]|uniref:Kinesin motor domain-containing protein n=1 Tax=Sphagnum jensenii TaxID=128206 RepID=A0ABP0WLR2_9BRYO
MYPMRLFSQSPKKAPFEKDLEKCLSSGCEEDVVADPVRSEGGEKALSYKSEFVELAIEHDAVGTGKGNDAETVGPVRIISSPSASRIQSGNSRAEVTPDLAVEASVSTPSKKLRQSSSFSGFSSREAGCGVSRTMAQGGGSFNRSASDIVCGTPRSGRSIAGKPPVDADTTSTNRNQGVLQKEAVTPSKNANRALKYGGAPSNASFVAGLSSTRATSSAANQLRSTGTSGPVQISSQLRNEQHFYLEDDPSFWQDHNVQVLIRIRPLSSTESVQGFGKCVRQENAHTISWLGQPESRFTFDHVAGEMISQEELFQVAGLPMVTNCMAGYNSCMFAYGQTGSGKTHTMLGDIGDLDHQPSDNRGMTPRVFECLFAQIRMAEEARKCENLRYMCKCSFLEIYNEQITDLLDPSSVNLQLREDINKGVYVENLTEVEVQSVQDVVQLLLVGAANRRVAATNMNRESSRSHSVFTCIIQSQWECDSMINFRFGRLNLVDLAGSERQKSSGAEGDRLKEAVSINKSLSTLGLVIMVLVDIANGKQRHVPYRDSKLSFLLQDSLGGNSKTTIIANISPSSCSSLETLSTLRFAQRAKFIQNNAVVNEDASGDVNGLRQQIQQLKEELARLRRQSISRFPTVRPTGSPHDGILEEDDSLDGPTPPSCSLEGSFLQFGSLVPSPTILTKKIKMLEANLTGALRREQEAELSTKRFGLEIEHANRLVKELEENTQYNKLILQFREDKIRRLESLSTGVLSADAYLMEENNAVMEELQLLRDLPVQNPELTRLAMENLCLHEQLRRFQEFDIGGEREAMAQEISHLRDQLQQQLDSTKAALEGEQACRRELEEKIACFRSDPTNRENMHHETEIGSEALSPATKIRHHDAIMQLEMELDSMDGGSALLVTGHQWQRGGPEFLVTGEGGTEMQHSVTIMQLQLDLESAQTALEEERANLKEAKQQSIDLKEKLQGAVLKLEEDKALIEALEDQQIFSINELESLQAKHQRVIELLRRREEKERVLKHRIYQLQWELKEQELQSVERELCEGNKNGVMDEACRSALEMKLVKARMELEKVQRLNHSFQAEKAFHSALEQEMDVTRLEAESETALAITSMQSELIEMRAEVDAANQREAQARKLVNKLEEEVKTANAMLENVQEVNTSWASKYKRLKWEKHKELLALQQDWEGAAARVMDYLTKEERKTDKEGKKNTGSIGEYLEDAGDCHHLTSCKDSESAMDRILHGISKNQEVMETTKKHMSDVHQIATMASDMVKHLGDSFFCSVYTGATEEMKEVWKSYQETKVLKLKLESCEAKLREVGRKANAAFIMACWISEAIRTRQIAQSRLRMDLTEGVAKVQQKEMQYECQRTLKNECAFCEIQDEAVKAHEGLSDLEEERVQLEKFEIQVQESGNALENLQAELKKAEIGLQEVHCIALKMAVAQGGSATTDCGWRSSRKMSTVTPENNSDECVLLVENALNGAQQQLQSLRTENCDRRAWDITAVSEVKEKLEALNEKEEEITKLKEQIAEQFEEWSSRANIDIPSVDTQAHLLKNDQATLAVQRRLADPQAQFNSTSSEVGSFIDFQETHGNVQMNKAIGIMNMELLLQKEEKIICLNKEFHETEVNAKKLPEKLDAFALSEQAWRSEKQSLCDEIESLRSCLATRVRACEALQKENLVLEEKGDAATRAYQSSDEILHNMERKLTKITVELAEEKRRAEISQLKLTGAEERVKVLLEAHSVMTDEWATERQSLHSEKDLLKIELSRLELHSEMQGGREQPLRNLKENRAVRSFDHGMSTAKHVEKLCQELERTRTDNVKLQTKLRERDSMLLSVRLELSAALADCKHAEAKLEQAVEERQALLHVEEELRLQISFLTEELQTLQEEVSWRQKHVDACQFQLESLTKILMETEERTHEAEQEWRKEKVQIETELQKARTNAHERHVEAVALSAKFKEWQGTLQDADLLVNALVQANDSARQDAWQWKLEKESMGSVQVEQIAQVLEETLEAVAVARKEVDVLMRDIECQMEDLIAEIRILKVEIRHKYWKVETGTLESGEQQKEKCADAFGDSEVGGYYVSHIKCLEDEQKQFNTETAVLVDNKSPIRSLHAEVMRSQKQIVAQRDHAVTLQLLQEKEETVVMLVHELNKLKHSSNHLEKEVRTKVEGKECGRDSNLRQSFTLKVVKEKDDTLNLLKEEREHLKSMVEGLESEVLEWQQRCLEAETALKEKVRTIADLQSEIDESHERLGEQVTTLADQLEERNQHVSELECQRMELREEMQRQAIAFASLHEQLQRQDCSLEGEAKSIAIKVSEEKEVLRTLEEEKAELKSMVERLDAEVRFFERKAADVETSMAEMERIRLDRESLQVKLNCVEVLQLELDIQNSKLSTMAEQRSNLEASLTQKTVEFNLITEELNTIRASAASVTQESEHLKEQVGDLEAKALSLEQDLLKKQQAIDCLEAELVTVEENMARCLEDATADLKELASERDALHNELLMLSKQLVVVQALADEREAVVAEAQQVAELSRSHAEEKQQEAEILGKSVEELETTVYVLESQLEGLKRDMERQRLMREDMEMELQVLNNHMSMLQAALDEAGARSAKELLEAQFAREEAERFGCCANLSFLIMLSEKQASEFESKLKAVEIKLEERKCQHSTPKAGKLKGTGSTFTCIGMGHQVHSELAEDRISYELRIQELETLLSSQHKENSMLNDKLVEAEKMTYDVVHDLLGVKSNISNVVTLLGQQQAELLLQNGCNNSPDDAQEKEEALENLTSQLNDFIQERESWLEEIKQKQAEVLAARLSTDKLRERDKRLIEENNKFKAESIGQQKRIGDLEQEMRKLSGQQNLQQRIQHHAKIKDENNALRIQNDELSGKLRRAELLYARVNDELSKYRSADGKQPFLDIDEEQRLCNMLQEAEADRVQMAHTLLGLCTSVMKASGITVGSEQNIEPSAALEALEQLTQQLASTQQELSDCRIKIRIEGERQRLEDLRAMHSPMKPVNLSGLAPR